MRKFASSAAIILSLFYLSCDKQDAKKTKFDDINYILSYLDDQKSTGQAIASDRTNANIDLLKENLYLDEATHEILNNTTALMIVPLKAAFIEKARLDQNSTLTLVLVTDSLGTIKSGTVVYFQPRDGRKRTSLPHNTFSHLFSGKPVEVDGTYKMLMMTGRLLSQFEVKDHRLFGLGTVQPKNRQKGNGPSYVNSKSDCVEWYMVSTYYYSDGTLGRNESYLGTSCPGDRCDPNFSSICNAGVSAGSSQNEETLTKESVGVIRDYETPPSAK